MRGGEDLQVISSFYLCLLILVITTFFIDLFIYLMINKYCGSITWINKYYYGIINH
jgi:hypothetical protein